MTSAHPPLSRWHLVVRSLAYHWRTQIALALGVAAATTVLIGALTVGDSVRVSLAHLAIDRLGNIDEILIADHFFGRDLADRLAAAPEFPTGYEVVPAILVPGNLKSTTAGHPHRASDVTIVGCSTIGKLGSGGPADPILPDQIVLNRPLADALVAKPGDEVLLQIGRADLIPPDSPLGRKTETTRSRRLTVAAVIAAEGLGRFGLRPSQQLPQNAFVAAETLADVVDQPGKVNALLIAAPAGAETGPAIDSRLEWDLKPTLADCGFSLVEIRPGAWQLSSQRLLIDRSAEQALLTDLSADHPQLMLTYLANTLRIGDREIPYSTVTAIDFPTEPPLGPFKDGEGKAVPPLAEGEIALNSWAADDLGAKVGDEVEVVYFEPESTHGKVLEQTTKLRLAAILPLAEEVTKPTADPVADRSLTPDLPGVTDQASIGDWDPPFPFDAKRVRPKDDTYWVNYRATPKAFVSLATGRKLWASRFGQCTAIRFATAPDTTAAAIESRLHLDPDDFGLKFLPVRRLALAAASGTTPFSVLFLSFSFFIIVSALLLVALLFGLALDQRAKQIGVLMAVGMRQQRLIRLLSTEGLLVAALGSVLGIVGGVGYAWLMVAGLRTWWLGAISTPFLQLHVVPLSLVVGALIGIAVSAATIHLVARGMRRASVCRLLAGQPGEAAALSQGRRRWIARIGWALLALAVAVGFASSRLGSTAGAGGFFGCGMLMLIGLALLVHAGLSRQVGSGAFSLFGLAWRNLARRPARSSLSIGLVAAASFLIVATNVFRLDPASETGDRRTGSGGFALIAQSDQPIYQDLNSAAGRDELGFSGADAALVGRAQVFALRVRPGDDASCLNLYQPTDPRILGVPEAMIDRGGFAWAASAAESAAERDDPWLLLDRELPAGPDGVRPVPIVLDMNTAQYSLHLYRGVGEKYEVAGPEGRPIRMEVVGLLKNSIFQGDLLMSQRQFLVHFPQVSGYRFFLIDTPPAAAAKVAEALDDTLENYGFSARDTAARLAELMAVQNTYLSTFQALGGLGLVLGTLGLAAVQLRSVLERRGELALMQAVGFRRRRLAAMVLCEHALLLIAGLALGGLAALVAVWPHLAGGAAAVPWLATAVTLGAVLAVGLAAGFFAARAVLVAQLLPALRAE